MEVINMRPADTHTSDKPRMLELRFPEYKRTEVRANLATIDLRIPLEDNILDGYKVGQEKVKNAIETYFRECHVTNVNGAEIFLPVAYHPAAAALAYDNIKRGVDKGTAVETYIKNHSGVLVTDIDSVYINFRAHSWFAKIWFLCCDPDSCDYHFM